MGAAASVLMQRARDQHAAFTQAQTPDAVLLRYLDRARDRLYLDAATINRAAFVRRQTTAFDPTLLTTGVTLPDHLWLGNVRMTLNIQGVEGGDYETYPLLLQEQASLTQTARVQLYAVVEQLVTDNAPAQNTLSDILALYPKSPDRWSDTTSIIVDYLPRLTPISKVTITTDLTHDADDALVDDLAKFMAMRGSLDKTKIDVGAFAMMAKESKTTYINSLAERRKPKIRQVREGW